MTVAQTISPDSLAASMRYCRLVTQHQARNFYYGLKLLPEPKRSAMFALYAYMRRADDLADDTAKQSPELRKSNLEDFRRLTHAAMDGITTDGNGWAGWTAFAKTVREFQIPRHLLDSMVDAQVQDLNPVRIATFEQLHEYCYRVASVVGLASICIWGFIGGERTQNLAIDRGVAFQLTNVLRDLREDAVLGRIYLPSDELLRFGVTVEDLMAARVTPQFYALMKFQIERAMDYYHRSAELDGCISMESRPTLYAMTEIYRGILKKISRQPSQVLSGKVRLNGLEKTAIALRACLLKKG